VLRGDAEALRALIGAGFPVDGGDVNVHRAGSLLELAVRRRDEEMVGLLLGSKAVWRQATLDAVLLDAARQGNAAWIDSFLARGANVHVRGEYAMTPLLAAAGSGVPAAVERLLRGGGSVLATDEHGLSVLHRAVLVHRLAWPVPARRNVNRKKVVELLIAAGADLNARNESGDTPLFSDWVGGEDIAAVMIAAGADVNARNAGGRTPLFGCNAKVARMLLEAGADPYVVAGGETALGAARRCDDKEAAVVLEQWMKLHPKT
jgi:ankyrin repeat protein